MSQWLRIAKSTTIVSAVLLVGSYVSYSCGMVIFFGGTKSSPVFQYVTPSKTTAPSRPQPKGQPKTRQDPQQPFTVEPNGDVKWNPLASPGGETQDPPGEQQTQPGSKPPTPTP